MVLMQKGNRQLQVPDHDVKAREAMGYKVITPKPTPTDAVSPESFNPFEADNVSRETIDDVTERARRPRKEK